MKQLILLVIIALAAAGCSDKPKASEATPRSGESAAINSKPSATPTPSPSATASISPAPSAAESSTPTPTPATIVSPKPTASAAAAGSPKPTATAAPASATPKPTAAETAAPKPSPSAVPTATPAAASGDSSKAQALYKDNCLSCHGTSLEGDFGPNLTKVGARKSKEQIAVQIAKGGKSMPGFEKELDTASVEALAVWLESMK